MSFPPRPPMPVPMPFMGIPGMPPPLMGGHGHPGGPPPMQFFGNRMPVGPPPNMMPGGNIRPNRPVVVSKPPQVNKPDSNSTMSTSMVQQQSSGPPVTVFVGNITEKWPDAMIRQLLATCGQVVNWKRVQGASGKLQGFGFCEFNGPDSGLRAVRLLHGLEVGDKKLVVKVDGKTSTVLEEYKAERKLKIKSNTDSEQKVIEDGKTDDSKEDDDYMDDEMKEADDRSKVRIGIIFREFKNEIDAYIPPGEKSEKDTTSHKQNIQDKLHLLKLSSLDKKSEPTDADADLPDEMMEEGKREIITREISNFRENMKQEKQKEEERKKIVRERRERERAREERRKDERDKHSPDSRRKDRYSRSPGPRGANGSPSRLRRSRSRTDDVKRIDRRRSRSRDRRGDRGSERDRDRRTPDRDRDGRRRRSSRERKSRSKSRERSPLPQPKPRYREREEEEEAAEQKRLERKAREKEAAYEDRLRIWELREQKKAKELKREKERQKRQEEEQQREAKRMKQFFEDYDDEKMDHKYYRGKELQKRLADRTKELEADNKDRQKEREELEEIKLRMLTSNTTPPGGTPLGSRFNQYKKPMTDTTNTTMSPFLKTTTGKSDSGSKKSPVGSKLHVSARLQALAGGPGGNSVNNGLSPVRKNSKSEPPVATVAPFSSGLKAQPSPAIQNQQTSFSSIQFSSFVPLKSNPTTPNSITASPVANVAQMSPSLKSLAGTGFQITLNNTGNSHEKDRGGNFHDSKDEDSRNSFSFAPSPGMASPLQSREEDDSSMPDGLSPADMPKKKKIDVKDVFNQDEDDNDGFGSGKKRKLVPLDFGDETKKAKKEEKIPEDKKKHIKSLIDKIPTDKEALFSHEIDWDMLDNSLMEKRIRPWINKKIIDYIGEPEPTLVDFICSKVLGRSAPQLILDDVMMVLDEEAEVFVVKMWRLLVYEIAAKKYGISNNKGDK